MADISESFCLNHPDTPAVARCATCGKPVCSSCLVSRGGSSYCSKACADSAANSVGRVDSALESKRRTDARSLRRNLIIFIILVLAAAAGYYFYTRNKENVNSFIEKTGKDVQKNVQSTKSKIQKGVPGDSKYKRDREALTK
ncbi:MAG: B-box zinc finger protein [Lentisphaeria bacterium]|nr:B-box zinc finger protein [Lentisphaeria bacterium]